MTNLERLLRGDKATYYGEEIFKIIDMSEYDTSTSYWLICVKNKYYWESISGINEHDYLVFTEAARPRTIEDGLKEGDVIARNGQERLILGVCGSVYILSYTDDFNTSGLNFTLHELIRKGWELKTEQPQSEQVEMTLEEIAELKGISVEQLRIKE